MATTAFTYDDKSMREDLLGIITNLDFKENQLMSGLGTGKANSIYHEWLKDTLKTPAVNARVEGAAAPGESITNPTRLTNVCQIVGIDYTVTDTERSILNAGFNDRLAYEATKAMKEWKQDCEFALMRGTMACGNNSVARSLKGIKAFLTLTSSSSGTSLTESALNDWLQAVWNQGTEVNAIYAPVYLKRKISGFTAGATKNVETTDRRLVAAVDIYQSDAASNVKLFKHRFVTVSGDTNYDLVGINEDMFKIAYLRKPEIKPIAKTGDATTEYLVGELTLECLHDAAGFNLTKIL